MIISTLRSSARLLILFGIFLLSVGLWYVVQRSLSLSESMQSSQQRRVHSAITTAIIQTPEGDITFTFDKNGTPKTADNFMTLAERGFYDGTRFHRVAENGFIQGGDPYSRGNNVAKYGKGGPGYTIDDEFSSSTFPTAGSVVMYNTGPHTAGSQFFILTADLPAMFGKYTIFGHVIDGLDVVESISKIPAGEHGLPNTLVPIEGIVLK